jgi:hypothetical protein
LGETPLRKVEEEKRLLERIETFIPGFRGYKQKEVRREADKLVRNKLYQELKQSENRLKDVLRELVDHKLTAVLEDVDRLIAKFDEASEEMHHASYGYSGFYDAVKIEEDDLDRMIDFDTKLLENVKGIGGKVKTFEQDVMNERFDSSTTHIEEIRSALDQLESIFIERRNIIQGVTEE